MRPRPPDTYAALLRELSAIGNNINQIAHWANARKDTSKAEVEETIALVRQDIDAAIAESFTFESFLAALRRQGYTVKYGPKIKHTTVSPPGGGYVFRLNKMGEGYTEADIRARLARDPAAQLNAVTEQMGYPLPQKAQEDNTQKKRTPALHKRNPRKSARVA